MTRSKYSNVKSNGYSSKREERRANELKLLERAGEIADLQEQVAFTVIPACGKNRPTTYIADFTYTRNGKRVVEDCKGMKTEVYRIKKKLMLHQLGIEVYES